METSSGNFDFLGSAEPRFLRLARLESAILIKAFRGKLVRQDPNDEPAIVLVDRIRAQRAAVPKATRGRRPRETVHA